jgi:hypothetical protein
MATNIETLGIDKLPVDEQLALVHAIWDHIASSGPRHDSPTRSGTNFAGGSPKMTRIPKRQFLGSK